MWKRLWEDVRSTVVQYLILSVLAGFVAAFATSYSGTQKVAGPMTPVVLAYLFVFTFVAVLATINQIGEIRDREARRRKEQQEQLLKNRQPSPDEIRTKIQEVLQRGPFSIQVMPTPANTHWQLQVTDANRLVYFVTHDASGAIVIAAGVGIAPEQLQEFRQIIEEPNSVFLEDLQMELAKLGVQFQVEGPPFRGVEVLDTLTVDEALTSSRLVESLSLVRRSTIFVITFARRSTLLRRRQSLPQGSV